MRAISHRIARSLSVPKPSRSAANMIGIASLSAILDRASTPPRSTLQRRRAMVAWNSLSGPDEAGPEADKQSGEQAERDHGAGLDEVKGGGAHAQRRGLRVRVGPDAGLGPGEGGDRVLLLVLQAPALRPAPLALGLPGLGEGVELALGEDDLGR